MTASPLPGAIRLPGDVWVRGRGLRDPAPAGPAPDFGLYLGGVVLRRRHRDSTPWSHRWVRWPDMWLPMDWHDAAESIVSLHERARDGEAVEVACHGGHGRTGTVLACLATLGGLTPAQARRWVRAHYSRSAVETPWQGLWIRWFARNNRFAHHSGDLV